MSFIFSRNLCYLRNSLMIGVEVRSLRIYSGKSHLHRYNAYPCMLTISTEATHRWPLIGMPLSFNSRANFTSSSKEKSESEQYKQPHEGGEIDRLMNILLFNLKRKKVQAVRKLCGEWSMTFQIDILIKVELSVPRMRDVVKKLMERVKSH